MTDILARPRDPAPDWLLIRTARAECEAYAKANRAAIDAEWAAEWDGRIEPLTGAEKARADAEWDALPDGKAALQACRKKLAHAAASERARRERPFAKGQMK